MVTRTQENNKAPSENFSSPSSAYKELPEGPARNHIHLPSNIRKKSPSDLPAKAPRNKSPCQLIHNFRSEVEVVDRHRYHLVRTALGAVALHRYDPDIGCVRTASFQRTPAAFKEAFFRHGTAPEFRQCMKVGENEINISEIKNWLELCTSSHLNCRLQRSRDLPASMKVIDCRNLTIVPWESGMKFAALSYTWGAACELDQPDRHGSTSGQTPPNHLLSNIPKTVEDAIGFIRKLELDGLHYLWVDRYCIDQRYLDEKHEQIQQMHLIYSNAEVTIIAAAGHNANYGLPGLGSSRRTPKSYLSSDSGPLVFVEASKKIITQSSWMRRGWTFQEAVFSRRRLFFTPEQVTFECANMTAHEILQIPLKYGVGCGLTPLFGLHLSNVLVEEIRPFSYYVEEYSRRVLTYESDALNAFSGILHALEEGRSQLRHLWAIEIKLCAGTTCRATGRRERCCTCSPTMSLLWDHEYDYGLSHRRHEYPSWSWLGWKGPVTFSRIRADTSRSVAIWAERLDGSLQRICSKSNVEDLTFNPSSYSHFIHITACTFDVKIHRHGNKVLIGRRCANGTDHTAVVQSGNTSLMTGDMAGETVQVILLNRHESFGWHSILSSLLIVKKDEDGAAYSRVGVCEVKWYPFCYAAEKAGHVRTIRMR